MTPAEAEALQRICTGRWSVIDDRIVRALLDRGLIEWTGDGHRCTDRGRDVLRETEVASA